MDMGLGHFLPPGLSGGLALPASRADSREFVNIIINSAQAATLDLRFAWRDAAAARGADVSTRRERLPSS
jgi:hypothetical protein